MPKTSTLVKRNTQYIKLNMTPEALVKGMQKHGLTAEKVLKPIAEALNANKMVIVGSGDEAFVDVQPDHSIRLKAASMAIELLGFKKTNNAIFHAKEDNQAITKALKGMDEVELQRAVFRKGESDTGDK